MRRKTATILLMIIITSICYPAYPQGYSKKMTAWDMLRKGVNRYENAEEILLQGREEEALVKFEDAMIFFQNIEDMKPDKRIKKILPYRIKLCRRKIDSIIFKLKTEKAALRRAAQYALKNPQTTEPSKADKKRITTLEKALKEYKELLFNNLSKLEAYKREAEINSKAASQVQELMKENKKFEAKYALLLMENSSLKKKTLNVPKKTHKLQQSILTEKIKYAKLLKQVDDLKSENSSLKKLKGERSKTTLTLKFEKQKFLEKIASLEQKLKHRDKLTSQGNKTTGKQASVIEELKSEISNLKNIASEKDRECKRLNSKLDEIQQNSNPEVATRQIQSENKKIKNELNILLAEKSALLEKNRKLSKSTSKAITKFERINILLGKITEERNSFKEELIAYDKRYRTLKDSLYITQKNLKISENKNSILTDEIELFASKYEEFQARQKEQEHLAKKHAMLVKQLEELTLKNRELANKKTSENQELKALQKELKEYQKNIETNKSNKSDLHKQLAENQRLKQINNDIKSQLKTEQVQHNQDTKQLKLTTAKEIKNLKGTIEQLKTGKTKLNEKFASLNLKQKKLQFKYANTKKQMVKLKTVNTKNRTGLINSYNLKLKEQTTTVNKLIKKLANIEKKENISSQKLVTLNRRLDETNRQLADEKNKLINALQSWQKEKLALTKLLEEREKEVSKLNLQLEQLSSKQENSENVDKKSNIQDIFKTTTPATEEYSKLNNTEQEANSKLSTLHTSLQNYLNMTTIYTQNYLTEDNSTFSRANIYGVQRDKSIEKQPFIKSAE